MELNCVARVGSTVPTQSLQLWNSEPVRESARYLAGRVIDEVGEDAEKQVERVYLRALSRRRPMKKDNRRCRLAIKQITIWGGEFGRLPLSQGHENPGRDHGSTGFTVWLAGGGVKGGTVYGATDEFGYHAVENRVSVHDFHATVLHLLGIDHEKLVYNHHGLSERLSGFEPAHVIREILA
jgi:Protein of unknown function (DUF1501)/Protein of unknown function (DUF1553)